MMHAMMTIMTRITTPLIVIDAPSVDLMTRCKQPLNRRREEFSPTCRLRRRALIPIGGDIPEISSFRLWFAPFGRRIGSNVLMRPEVARLLLELAAHGLRHLLAYDGCHIRKVTSEPMQ